ncbi:unnamed protein product [Alopecurus aequalis]
MSSVSPVFSDSDDELGPILSTSTSEKSMPSAANPVVSDSDDDEVPLAFRRASAPAKNRPWAANPVVSHSDDDEVPLAFKMASALVKNRVSVVNPDIIDNYDDYVSWPSFKKAITFVKNRSWAANPVIVNNEPPLRSSKRASTSLKNRPTLLKRKRLVVRRQLPQNHNDEQFSTEDSEGDEKTQKIEDHAKSWRGDGGRLKKKHKGTTSVPSTEDSMLAYIDRKREQGMEQKVSQQGQQYSISRCLEVLHAMDDVSDEIKVLASDVLKDAASREFFLCYESRLRGLWLKKEVAKLGTQLPPW